MGKVQIGGVLGQAISTCVTASIPTEQLSDMVASDHIRERELLACCSLTGLCWV